MSGDHGWIILGVLALVLLLFLTIHSIATAARRASNRLALSRGRRTTNTVAREDLQRFVDRSTRRVLHEDTDEYGMPRQLVRVPMRFEEDVFAVRVHDTTTKKVTYLRVPPGMKSCHQAVAWTFDLPPEDFQPVKGT